MTSQQRAELIRGHANGGKDAAQGALEQILAAVDWHGHGTAVRMAHDDPKSRTVSLIMDPATANITMFAVSAHAGDREAHVREIQQVAESCRRTPTADATAQAIAAREARVAARLRAVERAYRTAIEHEAAVKPEPSRTLQPVDHMADHEMELE